METNSIDKPPALSLDEVFVKINGELHYLWRAVDQDGEVVEDDGSAFEKIIAYLENLKVI